MMMTRRCRGKLMVLLIKIVLLSSYFNSYASSFLVTSSPTPCRIPTLAGGASSVSCGNPVAAVAAAPRTARGRRTGRVVSSSPFDSAEYDKAEAAQREAEELEQMIRGRRGVVMELVEREWKEALETTIEEEGERLCAEAYEGFKTKGRGGIFVNVDMGLSSSSKGHSEGANHAVYRSLEEVVSERSSRVRPNDQMQIIQRCQEYDPETGFVLVFGHKGLLGVQVIRPSSPPKEILQARQSDRTEWGTSEWGRNE